MSRALAADRLGAPTVVYFVLSAAAPLTVVAGVVTTGYAVTGITGLPVAFLVVGVVLAVFAVGYVAMARHLANAGAFYTYVTRGLGRPAGIAAAWVALIAYNTLQVALYGAFGVASAPLFERWLGVTPAWWALSLAAWALVAALGLMRVDVNGRLLAVLLTAEVAVILLFDLADLANPAAAGYATGTLSPAALFVPGVGRCWCWPRSGSSGSSRRWCSPRRAGSRAGRCRWPRTRPWRSSRSCTRCRRGP
ncbi:amino acid permease-associated region [[Actinomadura] parvosata subsp. kistnae]|nr:amino acid permease-associated region [Actinomadura parvosata subsp. kistnae]